jgi:hypothetical protein
VRTGFEKIIADNGVHKRNWMDVSLSITASLFHLLYLCLCLCLSIKIRAYSIQIKKSCFVNTHSSPDLELLTELQQNLDQSWNQNEDSFRRIEFVKVLNESVEFRGISSQCDDIRVHNSNTSWAPFYWHFFLINILKRQLFLSIQNEIKCQVLCK